MTQQNMAAYGNGAAGGAAADSRRAVALWLFVMCALVYAMVILGGVTRLTQSGLSMVNWHPVVGWLPPTSETEWQKRFTQYQQFPEYKKKNFGMTLSDFKGIFWLEFLHRLLGRLIGIAFLLPFLWFALRGRLDRRLVPKLAAMFVLGGLQGLMGWYMVESGLVNRPDVSQYRLTAHLGLAVAIYGLMLWTALGLLAEARGERIRAAALGPRRLALTVATLIAVTMLSGGLVAGLDAGFAYNTFPLMDGRLVPPGAYGLHPWWLSAFEDIATVQFDHRVLAMATLTMVVALWVYLRRRPLPGRARLANHVLLAAGLAQVSLGIATLLSVVAIPLAATHQAGALALFTVVLWLLRELAGTTKTA